MKISPAEAKERLGTLPGWKLEGEEITKTFTFADFTTAFSFMTAVALEAERLNHHPDWQNVYNKVNVRLSTHSEQGITELDFQLAAKMDKIAGHY